MSNQSAPTWSIDVWLIAKTCRNNSEEVSEMRRRALLAVFGFDDGTNVAFGGSSTQEAAQGDAVANSAHSGAADMTIISIAGLAA